MSGSSREVTQAEAARRHGVDVSKIIGIRRTVKDAALAALVARPGRRPKERNWELEQTRRDLHRGDLHPGPGHLRARPGHRMTHRPGLPNS